MNTTVVGDGETLVINERGTLADRVRDTDIVGKIRDGGEKLAGQAGEKARGFVSQGLERAAETLGAEIEFFDAGDYPLHPTPEMLDRTIDIAFDHDSAGERGSIAIAQAYPNITVDVLDLDSDVISAARRNAERVGVADRPRPRRRRRRRGPRNGSGPVARPRVRRHARHHPVRLTAPQP